MLATFSLAGFSKIKSDEIRRSAVETMKKKKTKKTTKKTKKMKKWMKTKTATITATLDLA